MLFSRGSMTGEFRGAVKGVAGWSAKGSVSGEVRSNRRHEPCAGEARRHHRLGLSPRKSRRGVEEDVPSRPPLPARLMPLSRPDLSGKDQTPHCGSDEERVNASVTTMARHFNGGRFGARVSKMLTRPRARRRVSQDATNERVRGFRGQNAPQAHQFRMFISNSAAA